MRESAPTRRMSFKTRLTLLIAGVFVLGGAAIIGVQFRLVQQFLDTQVQVTSTLDTENFTSWRARIGGDDGFDAVSVRELDADALAGTSAHRSEVDLDNLLREAALITSLRVSDGVQHSLLVWSGAVLAGFTLVAVLAGSWLSRHSLGRVADITTTMHAISAEGLDRRLALVGPRDEIRELGDAIDSTLDRLEAAFERQDRFIAGASHELRTPLTVNRSLLEIPLSQGRFPADLEPAVRGALEANERSSQLVSALLALTRARYAPRSDASTDLTGLVATLLGDRGDAIAARGLTATAPAVDDIPGPRTLAAVSPDLALLAVGNLLDNAVRHNTDSGRITVATGHDATTGTAWVEVVNDGADLTGTDVEELKEAFHRGSSSRLAGDGMGLGLALIDMVATTSGGALALTARPEGGLRARLTLPGAKASSARRTLRPGSTGTASSTDELS